MAKDGTNRGGLRIGAGRPRKAKIDDNTTYNNFDTQIAVIPKESISENLPEVDDYMKAEQKNGKPLGADKILHKLNKWLDLMGCRGMINPMLLDQYAMDRARWIQLQNAISDYGFVTRKNSTGNITQSPFFIELSIMEKQMNNTLFMINQIVRENIRDKYIPMSNEEREFEALLTK